MIWPWVMPYSTVDFGVWVTCPFRSKLPYRPLGLVLVVEKLDECVRWVAIRSLRIGRGGARGCNDFLDNGLVGR